MHLIGVFEHSNDILVDINIENKLDIDIPSGLLSKI